MRDKLGFLLLFCRHLVCWGGSTPATTMVPIWWLRNDQRWTCIRYPHNNGAVSISLLHYYLFTKIVFRPTSCVFMCSAPLFNDHVPARILPNYIGFKRGPFAVMVAHQVVFHLGGLPKLDWASPGKSRRATSSRRLLYIEQQQSVFEESYKCVFGGNPNRRRPICFQKTKN